MRSTLRSLLPLALLLSVAGCKSEDDAVNERRLVILFTTDEHSQLFATPELDDLTWPAGVTGSGELVGGVARRMTILQAQRDAAAVRGAATLTLSSGDFSQGSLASAAWVATSPELAIMGRMGYDAVALGNHEFDLGPAALAAAVAAAGDQAPPLVLTNITFSGASAADDGLAALYGDGNAIAPYRVLTTSNGLRIGIVASMGVEAGTVAGAPAPVTFFSGATQEEQFGSVLAAVQAGVDQVRAQGVDAVILLAHGGIARHPAGPDGTQLKEDELMALQLEGVDLVLSGHSHLFTPQPRIMYGAKKSVPVVQPKPYGQNVGKVELVFRDDGKANRPFLDRSGTAFFDVDDRTLPTEDAAFLTDLYTRTVGYLEAGNPAFPTYPSFLEETLSTITGAEVTDDAGVLGDLWLYPMCQTTFDVVGLAPGETNAMNLDTDAILDAVSAIEPTEIAVQASGPIRGDLEVGETGVLAFADVYHVVPLGGDPTAAPTDPNAIPGYPLVRFDVPTAALRGVYEMTLQTAYLQNGDFFLGASGLVVNYDITRPLFDAANPLSEGWVTYMGFPDGTPLYDVNNAACDATAHFCVHPNALRSVATTLYIAGFASAFGVTLYDDAVGTGVVGMPDPGEEVSFLETILSRTTDGSRIKDFEALGAFLMDVCAGNPTDPGFLPAEYGDPVPRRVIDCTGGCPGGPT
jgi:2',3'-cyclic-nucleotide 2'-phosphodiesterase (5'-nucleotidase family)